MVITLELPLRQPALPYPPIHLFPERELVAYRQRFGATPDWIDEAPAKEIIRLVRGALRRGVPLTAADGWY